MRKHSWGLETSGGMKIGEALWEREGKAVRRKKKKKGTAPNPERAGERGREMDDFSGEKFEWSHRRRPLSEWACIWAGSLGKRKHLDLVHRRRNRTSMSACETDEDWPQLSGL